jgi:hypothetical protein
MEESKNNPTDKGTQEPSTRKPLTLKLNLEEKKTFVPGSL